MNEEQIDRASAEEDEDRNAAPGPGESLVRRAVEPGVASHDLARRLVARSRSATGSLAAEIRRRWLPGAPMGGGPALPYFGGGTVPARPVARAVAVRDTPGAQSSEALSGMGAAIQRRHAEPGVTRSPHPPAPSPSRTPALPGEGEKAPPVARVQRAPAPLPASGEPQGVETPSPTLPRAIARERAPSALPGPLIHRVAAKPAEEGDDEEKTVRRASAPTATAGDEKDEKGEKDSSPIRRRVGSGPAPLLSSPLSQPSPSQGGGTVRRSVEGSGRVEGSGNVEGSASEGGGALSRAAGEGRGGGPVVAPEIAPSAQPGPLIHRVAAKPAEGRDEEENPVQRTPAAPSAAGPVQREASSPAPADEEKDEGSSPIRRVAQEITAPPAQPGALIHRMPAPGAAPAAESGPAPLLSSPLSQPSPSQGGGTLRRSVEGQGSGGGGIEGGGAEGGGALSRGAGEGRGGGLASAAPASPPPGMQVQIFGPPILRRSAGGPLPLAELRRKAAGSGEEDEKTSAGSPSIQAKALPVPPAAPDLSRMPAFPSGDAPLASLLRRAPAPAPPSPERPGAAPAAPPASPGSPVPFSPESFPLPVALQRSVAPPGALPENLPGAAPSGAAPGAPAGPLPGHAAPPSGGPAPLSRIARGLSLPLARAVQPGAGPAGSAAGTVQREVTAAPGTTPPASEPPVIGGGDAPQAGAAGTAQNDDELVERVLRRLMRTLTVEGERRGARRWP